jgi:hypothetical protein
MRVIPFLCCAFLLTSGCSRRTLTPAPQADRVAGLENAARDQANGVSIVVQPNHWEGDSPNLRFAVTPVHVALENRSGHPLQVAYRRFHLVTDGDFRSTANPPFRIEGSIPQTAVTPYISPAYPWNGFYLAPYYATFYGPAWSAWPGVWHFDHLHYSGYTTWRQPLPTEDMLTKALPEGVLQNGGNIQGFLYFQKLPDNVSRATFHADLFDAETEQTMATMEIPFVVTE